MKKLWPIVVLAVLISCCSPLVAGRVRGQEAATADEAAAVLDLSRMSRPKQVGPTMSESVAALSYYAESDVTTITKLLQQQLEKGGWKAIADAAITPEYASATFQKQGFSISLTVTPGGEPGKVLVALSNHGNVDVRKLKLPKGMTGTYATPAMAMYNSQANVAETRDSLLKELKAAGWEPFGDTTVSFFVKKNAVRLQVMVSDSPAQPGKASVQISSDQLSVDLPAPTDVENLQYSDSPTQLSFQGMKNLAHWVAYFKDSLGRLGWKATTENTVKIGFTEHLIFRNDKAEMIEITMRPGDDQTRVLLKFSNAEQVKREQQKADAAVAKAKRERDQKMNEKETGQNKVSLSIPKGTELATKTAKSVELSAKSGTAQKLIADWLKQLKAAGWEVRATIDSREAGHYDVKRGDIEVNVLVIDPGFIPARITVSVSGDKQLEMK